MTDPLPPLRGRLRAEAARLQAPIELVERDYALGHVLAAIYGRSKLSEALVFKGGTALKKAHFGDYRFSVDLDFTAVGGPRGDDLEAEIGAVAAEAARSMGEHGPFGVAASRRVERQAHEGGQEAFRVAVRFPWHREPLCSVKVEVTLDEPLLLPAQPRELIHGYDERLATTLSCYTLEEIVAEKLRTTLQAQRRLDEGRWLRDCARDYYDLWRLCVGTEVRVDFTKVRDILPAKCATRGVEARAVDDFFPKAVVEGAGRQWGTSLANLVRPLPPFQAALDELRVALRANLGAPRLDAARDRRERDVP